MLVRIRIYHATAIGMVGEMKKVKLENGLLPTYVPTSLDQS